MIGCGAGEFIDGSGIDGNGGFAIKGVERRCSNGCIGDGDGLGRVPVGGGEAEGVCAEGAFCAVEAGDGDGAGGFGTENDGE